MSTLYVTDLDGTLLAPDKRLTEKTVAIVNGLLEQGLLFSVDTARSIMGIELLHLDRIRFRLPLILMNGALLYDLSAGRIVDAALMDGDTVARVLALCREGGKAPFLYRAAGDMVTVHFTDRINVQEAEFLTERRRSHPDWFFQAADYGPPAPAVYFSMQDTYERLESIGRRLEELPQVSHVLYEDNYHKDNWYMEIFSAEGGKDNGMRRLQHRIGAGRTAAIGDNFNDLPMLAAADLALVVENGQPEVKAAADRIIGANDRDGVALYLQEFAALD